MVVDQHLSLLSAKASVWLIFPQAAPPRQVSDSLARLEAIASKASHLPQTIFGDDYDDSDLSIPQYVIGWSDARYSGLALKARWSRGRLKNGTPGKL